MHVPGNKATAFCEFKRKYDLRLEDRRYQMLYLAHTAGRLIHDAIGHGNPRLITIARNRLESLALTIPPHGPSPNQFDLFGLYI